jgi:hypothetical protein
MRRWLVWMGMAVVVLAASWSAMAAADRPVQQQATPSALGAGVDAQEFFFDARLDLETLIDSRVGPEVRPEGWTGNLDTASAAFAPNLWYDSELLANAVYGEGQRPDDWQPATTTSQESLVRSVRRNLETVADEVFGLGTRPQEWRGASALLRCDRTLLNTLSLLELLYRYERTTPDSAINFCEALQAELELRLNELVFSTPNQDGAVLDPIELLGGMRGDLERLADELLGLNTRPGGYIGNRDARTLTFISDAFLDMNALANLRLGAGVRPAGWAGSVAAAAGPAYYTLRYDLELLADATLPPERTQDRPTGWQGETRSERCRPAVSYLTFLVREGFNVSLDELDPQAADYCAQLEEALNAVAENPPVLDEVEVEARFTGASNYAFAYLDVGALQYMGVMPGGTPFRAVSRNYGDSTMMFVVGNQFAVYVDRRFTSVEETVFNSLPTIDPAGPVAFCDAGWCNGPGPTPTPTGSSPLEQIVFGSTPQPTPNPDDLSTTKQLVSWEYVRVTYISDNLASRSAQVTLELCNAPAAVATTCEPATSVFDNAINAARPPVGQQNGQNVYDFRYGYNTAIVIESESFFSTDVWISDPTIR